MSFCRILLTRYFKYRVIRRRKVIKSSSTSRNSDWLVVERRGSFLNVIILIQYPNPDQHPNIGFDLYNPDDMNAFSSRDIRSLLTSYLSATSPDHSRIDVADMLVQVYAKIQTQKSPKIIVLLTNGNTADPEQCNQVVQELHELDVEIIPIAVSRKCR